MGHVSFGGAVGSAGHREGSVTSAGAGASSRDEPDVVSAAELKASGAAQAARCLQEGRVGNVEAVVADVGEHIECFPDAEGDRCRFRVAYDSHAVSKGGAVAYYAPEVARVEVGRGAYIDYSGQVRIHTLCGVCCRDLRVMASPE